MSYAQEIEIICSDIAKIDSVQINPVADDGFNVHIFLTYKGKELRQDFYLAADIWDNSGEIGVSKIAYNLLKSELEHYDGKVDLDNSKSKN